MKTILFWDIDGTLLTTGRAGIFALEDAASEVIGRRVELAGLETAGLTDPQIAMNILEHHGVPADADKVERLLRRYGEELPGSLTRKQGAVLKGVREILDTLHPRTDVHSFLLTGNIEAGAKAKLAHYGLDAYFAQGAFSDQTADRVAIARKALAMAEAVVGGSVSGSVYVIGDTPHDIHCGNAINARVVAVASGSYDLASLVAHQPWWTVPVLPEPHVFLRKIGLARE
jgi:phosphoglycolate phosphatase-like HAD superfamily hydrolase